jgi:hypothetical protein
MPRLRRVDLSRNFITDVAIPQLKRLRWLRVAVVLSETEITKEGTMQLTGSVDRYSNENASVGLPTNGALSPAVSRRDVRRVRWLLEQGADPNRGEGGWTPLHMAAANGELEIIRDLIDHGASLTTRNGRGITPLGAARENRQQAAVEMLSEAEEAAKPRETRQAPLP